MFIKSVLFCCLAVVLLEYGLAEELPICGLTTPCKFEVYNNRKVVIEVVDAPCVCQEGTICSFSYDKTQSSQYVHWCKHIPTTVPVPTVSTAEANGEF